MREISDTLQVVFALVGVAISVTALGRFYRVVTIDFLAKIIKSRMAIYSKYS